MVVATGYFAKAKAYSDIGYALVSIARVAPWFLARELRLYPCDFLAPTDEILALKDNPVEYTKRYNAEILAKQTPEKVCEYLNLIAHQENTDKVALLCYESPEKFCHRHLVADWLSKSINRKAPVKEIEVQRNSVLVPPSGRTANLNLWHKTGKSKERKKTWHKVMISGNITMGLNSKTIHRR